LHGRIALVSPPSIPLGFEFSHGEASSALGKNQDVYS
jgi:hypothetical protein